MSAGTSEFFCLICLLICSCTAQKIITAEVGQDVILPCKAPNIKNISDIRALEWSRPDLDPEYVLLYRNKRFDPDSQNPSYQDRVDLQDKEMKDGDASLILKNVTMEDNGIYLCHVSQKTKKDLISTIFLKVHLSAQEFTAELGQDVILPCKVPNINNITAVEWNGPGLGSEYVLLYQDGHLDPDNQHPSYQNRVDLQDKEMKDGDVSLILMNVKMEDTGTYECFAFHETKNELICIINLEVRLSDVPLKVQPSNTLTIVGWTLVVVVIILSAVGFAVYKILQIRKRKKEKKEKKEKQEELEQLMGINSETKNQLQQKTQENEALKNERVELKGSNSDTINPLQKEKLKNMTLMNRLEKKLKRGHSDASSELQWETQRNEILERRLKKLESTAEHV